MVFLKSNYTVITVLLGIVGFCRTEENSTATDSLLKHQDRLFSYLFKPERYNPHSDPTISEPLNVTFYFELHQILAVDETSQTVTIVGWLQEDWKDRQLYWNPEDYGGISSIATAYTDVWRPNAYLVNSVDMDKTSTENPTVVALNVYPENDTRYAYVTFGYLVIYKFTCAINMRTFPFDIQTCSMVFEPLLDKSRIVFQPSVKEVNVDYFQFNVEWTLLNTTLSENDSYYVTAPLPWSRVTAAVRIRRRPMYYIVTLILPLILISLFASIGLFIPVDSPECIYDKLNLGMTALLTFSIQLLQVSSQVPKGTSSVPILSWFFLGIMTHITLSTLIAVWICEPSSRAKVGRLCAVMRFCVTFGASGWRNRVKSISNTSSVRTTASDQVFVINTRRLGYRRDPYHYSGTHIAHEDFPAHTFCMIMSLLIMIALTSCICVIGYFDNGTH